MVRIELRTSLYAGITGECLNTGNSENFKLQSISRQPEIIRESSETTREELA